jgi:hypothetical protein
VAGLNLSVLRAIDFLPGKKLIAAAYRRADKSIRQVIDGSVNKE